MSIPALASGLDSVMSEETLLSVVDFLVRLVESAGALVIVLGAVLAFVRFIVLAVKTRDSARFVDVRLVLGRFLALGLEFQLAGDILHTAIAPSFAELGKLAAIAAIRTALNYFLAKELRDERDQVVRDGAEAAERRSRAGAPGQ